MLSSKRVYYIKAWKCVSACKEKQVAVLRQEGGSRRARVRFTKRHIATWGEILVHTLDYGCGLTDVQPC